MGAKIGKTHVASGTDLFWELRDEDLYKSIGLRFGLIAADPDLESGAYNEWGWNSAVLNNSHWFSYTGSVEPSRRQWYSTYFAGRVTSDGSFKPLTKYGYYAEGAFGVKNTENDWANYYRTMHFTDRVRPEQASGFGMVVSWNTQMRHMGKAAGAMGTGLYVAQGYDNANELAGNLYYKLVRDGIPVTFVASTDTLKKWDGHNPLIAVDGFSYTDDELKNLARLNQDGTPIIAVGWSDPGSAAAQSFFGVTATADGHFEAAPGTTVVTAVDHDVAYLTNRPGHGATLFCPSTGDLLTLQDAAALCQAMLEATGSPLETTPGVVPGAFVSFGKLFLTLNDEGDLNRPLHVSVKPAFFDAAMTGNAFQVIDMDHGSELPSTGAQGTVSFTLPTAASDGRLVMIVPKGTAGGPQ